MVNENYHRLTFALFVDDGCCCCKCFVVEGVVVFASDEVVFVDLTMCQSIIYC